MQKVTYFLINPQIKEEMIQEITKCFYSNGTDTAYQNVWDASEAV